MGSGFRKVTNPTRFSACRSAISLLVFPHTAFLCVLRELHEAPRAIFPRVGRGANPHRPNRPRSARSHRPVAHWPFFGPTGKVGPSDHTPYVKDSLCAVR